MRLTLAGVLWHRAECLLLMLGCVEGMVRVSSCPAPPDSVDCCWG